MFQKKVEKLFLEEGTDCGIRENSISLFSCLKNGGENTDEEITVVGKTWGENWQPKDLAGKNPREKDRRAKYL